MTAEKFLTTRATAVNNTWGKYVDKMEFFAQKGTYEQYNLRLVNLGNFVFYILLFIFLNSLSFKLISEHMVEGSCLVVYLGLLVNPLVFNVLLLEKNVVNFIPWIIPPTIIILFNKPFFSFFFWLTHPFDLFDRLCDVLDLYFESVN